MGLKPLLLIAAVVLLSGLCRGAETGCGAETGYKPHDCLRSLPLHTTPAGTFIRYGNAVVLLPGVHLPRQLLSTFAQASASVLFRRCARILLTLAMGQSRYYLSAGRLKQFSLLFAQGYLTRPLELWHLANQGLRAARLGLAVSGELVSRLTNFSGVARTGILPVYPGPELDRALFIDMRLRAGAGQLELQPLRSVALDTLKSSWQRSLGQLVNTALEQSVDLIRLTLSSDGQTLLDWHSPQGWAGAEAEPVLSPESRGFVLYPAGYERREYLLHWLRTPGRGSVPASGLVSLLEPAALECIRAHMAGNHDQCPLLDGLQQAEPVRESGSSAISLVPANGDGVLQFHPNRSWSPGLPGTLTLGCSQEQAERQALVSRQFRMPWWSVGLAEALLYQLAERVAEHTTGALADWLYLSWHDAGRYQLVAPVHWDGNTGSRRIRVDRVQDQQGKSWIRKSVGWKYPGSRTGRCNRKYFDLAGEPVMLAAIDHPNVVKVHDSWVENPGTDAARFVMIEEDAGLLNLAEHEITSMAEYRHIMRQLVLGMRAMHKAGVVHLDIKSSNAVINARGEVKLIDMDIARFLDNQGCTRCGLYTPSFSPPEKHGRIPWQADLWSLGSTALHLIALMTGDRNLIWAWGGLAEHSRADSHSQFRLDDYLHPTTELEGAEGLYQFLDSLLQPDYRKRAGFDTLLESRLLSGSRN